MFHLRGAALALLLVLPAVGAQAQAWSDWAEISPEDSYLHLSTPPGGLPTEAVSRAESRERETAGRREHWSWDTGVMYMVVLGGKFYMEKQSRRDLIETMGQWNDLKELDLQASKSDVERGANKLGIYYYTQVAAQNADLHCFFFLQNLRPIEAPGFFAPPDAASGYLTGFDCQTEETIAMNEHTDQMISYIKGLRRQ